MLLPGRPNGIEYRRRVFDLGVQFPAQFTGKGNPHKLEIAPGNLRRLVRQPTGSKVRIANFAKDFAGLRSGQNLARERFGHIVQRERCVRRHMLLQPFHVMPLRNRRGDQEVEIFRQGHDRHFGDDAAASHRRNSQDRCAPALG